MVAWWHGIIVLIQYDFDLSTKSLKWVGHDDIVFALIYKLRDIKINISI